MIRPARCVPAFTEQRHSKSPELCILINQQRFEFYWWLCW